MVSDMSYLLIPLIATIDGIALGGGLEIALRCDIKTIGKIVCYTVTVFTKFIS